MPAIKLHSPILGKNRGEVVSVSQSEADFYCALGYAVLADGQDAPPEVPGADVDLTNAANREGPDEDPPTSPDVEPRELQGPGTTHEAREAQAATEEQSEATRAKSDEVREEAVDGTTTEQKAAQAEADELSDIFAELGDNAADQPGDRAVPVTEPAEPVLPAVDPGIEEVADEGAPATKGTRTKKRG